MTNIHSIMGNLNFFKIFSCFWIFIWIKKISALPQTWEDPHHVDNDTKAKGDNDPLDACEIGSVIAVRGQVRQVKVLGTWAMIDEGETDWKILVIDVPNFFFFLKKYLFFVGQRSKS